MSGGLPFLPLGTTVFVEGNIAHLYYDGNAGERRDVLEEFKGYPWHKRFIIAQLDCLTESLNTTVDGTTEYHTLCEELKEVKEKEFKDEKIIRGILLKLGDLGCFVGGMNTSVEDNAEYPNLSEEMEKIEEKELDYDMILHALGCLNLEKIYVYE